MTARRAGKPRLRFEPVTDERWADLERLFGRSGGCAGCWCTWWKLKRSEWERRRAAGRKRLLRADVRAGRAPGLLAYHRDEPIGWCAVEPRERYPVLGRSPVLKPVDERPVWSVTCFFVRRDYRGRGVSSQLLRAAAQHARQHGGEVLEGYPVIPRKERMPEFSAFTGLHSVFVEQGFEECARRSPTRPIMRLSLRR